VGTLGVLLPPSVTLIVVGIITQLSIGKLFMAGIVPGLFIAFFFAVVIVGWCKINPEIGPKSEKFSWKERITAGKEVTGPIIIFLIIIGGFIYGFIALRKPGASELSRFSCSAS
jgi:C4-dicarboxylate transporter, DctM subunit